MKMDECILTDLTVDIGFNCYIRITYSHDDSSLIHYPQKVSGTQGLTGMTPEMDFLLPSIIIVIPCLLRGPVPPLGSKWSYFPLLVFASLEFSIVFLYLKRSKCIYINVVHVYFSVKFTHQEGRLPTSL
jgi:hypothetical protein